MTGPGEMILSEPIPLARATDGELEQAVREHARVVYKIAFAVLRNHHDAEDAAQETFLKFLRHRKRWPEIRDPRAWLAKMAWRVATDRAGRRHEVSLEEAAQAVSELRAQGADAERLAATAQMQALLHRLIAALPHELREVMTLSTAEELSSEEIGALLGIPEGSVRTRQMRARELLREKLRAVLERKP
ncbi:MAG TPA: RNA polymerase sigma factor [Terriglobia bacterium]|nr:RNA polymerase sigma factor [Terriglobia bacterium]